MRRKEPGERIGRWSAGERIDATQPHRYQSRLSHTSFYIDQQFSVWSQINDRSK